MVMMAITFLHKEGGEIPMMMMTETIQGEVAAIADAPGETEEEVQAVMKTKTKEGEKEKSKDPW